MRPANQHDAHGTIYTLHIQRGGLIRHYVGITTQLEKRLGRHQRGHGAWPKLVQRGATVTVVDVRPGSMWDERQAIGRMKAELGYRRPWPAACDVCARIVAERPPEDPPAST